MKLTILVADIYASYGMLVSRIFCRDMGDEIKLDWSQYIIPIGNKKIKLEPKEKANFTMMKFDDPKAQVLYQEMEYGNYMMFDNFNALEEELGAPDDQRIQTLDFDGSCATIRYGEGVVLISPEGYLTQLSSKLQFKNTNNIAEYKTPLLGITIAK